MSGIRSRFDLQQEMSSEFAWRKKELHKSKSFVVSNENTHYKEMAIRAATALLYAHWERFIRSIGNFYLEFVSRQQLKHEELKANFLAIVVRKQLRDNGGLLKMDKCLGIVQFFRSDGPKRSNMPWDKETNTKSNLNSDVFQEIVAMLGLDYTKFATKEKLLDEKLLKNRNTIAHGQYLLVDFAEYMSMHDEIVDMMQEFYDQVDNAAFTRAFRM